MLSITLEQYARLGKLGKRPNCSLKFKGTYKCLGGGGTGTVYFEYDKELEGHYVPELTDTQKHFVMVDDIYVMDMTNDDEFERYVMLTKGL